VLSQTHIGNPIINKQDITTEQKKSRGYYHQNTGVTKSHRGDITTGGGTNGHRSDIATGGGANSHRSDIATDPQQIT